MDAFLSWSGATSGEIAKTLRGWLPTVIPNVEPWMSEEDVSKGEEWFRQLMDRLSASPVCIACLTPDNIAAPWIHFEVGAIAARNGDAGIFSYLVAGEPSQLRGTPLSNYQ